MADWEHFKDTWPAFQGPVNLDRVEQIGTEVHRMGWPKPTIYREHEAIHLLANQIDALLAERKRLQGQLDEVYKQQPFRVAEANRVRAETAEAQLAAIKDNGCLLGMHTRVGTDVCSVCGVSAYDEAKEDG